MNISNDLFKRVLVIFWGLWWAIAFLTDLLGGLKHLNLIQLNLNIDVNYPFLVQSLKPFALPEWVAAVLFISLATWMLIATIVFFQAMFAPQKRFYRIANKAFIISLCLWLALFLADQVIMNFDLEANHMVQGGFELLSFLTFHLISLGITTKYNPLPRLDPQKLERSSNLDFAAE